MTSAASDPSPAKSGAANRSRNRWAAGIPRRRRKSSEPWQIQALRGLVSLAVTLGFLVAGLVVSVLGYSITGSETVGLLGGVSGLMLALLLTPRVTVRLLDYFN